MTIFLRFGIILFVMYLVLASASPRRKDILTKAGYAFVAAKSDFDEVLYPKEPIRTVEENAVGKAREVFKNLKDDSAVVLGADTVVVLDGKIIGKPKDEEDAKKTLRALSDNTHTVYTGYAVIFSGGEKIGHAESKVTFFELSEKTIEEYVKSGKPMDKAGSYGLQDGYITISSFTGSKSNIIGLPIEDLKPILDELLGK